MKVNFKAFAATHKAGTSKAGKPYSFYQQPVQIDQADAPVCVGVITWNNEAEVLSAGTYSAEVVFKAGQYGRIEHDFRNIKAAKA